MASNDYHNNLKEILEIYRLSHEQIIEKVCIELGHSEKIEELKELLLTEKLKIKPRRDPDKPKKPPTAYLLFSGVYRDKIKKDFPGLKFGESNKKLGEVWKSIDDEERKKFKEQAEQARTKYEEDLEYYNNNKKY